MSSNISLHEKYGMECRNPNITTINWKCPDVIKASAVIQKNIKNFQYNKHIQILNIQMLRLEWIKYLKQNIAKGSWLDLVKGGDDHEVAICLTDGDREHTLMKARHVAAALEYQYDATHIQKYITWKHACDESAKIGMCGIEGSTVLSWFSDLKSDKGTNDFRKLIPSARGKESTAAISPF